MMYQQVKSTMPLPERKKIIQILSCRAHGVARRDIYLLRMGLIEEGVSAGAIKSKRKQRIISHLWTRYYLSVRYRNDSY